MCKQPSYLTFKEIIDKTNIYKQMLIKQNMYLAIKEKKLLTKSELFNLLRLSKNNDYDHLLVELQEQGKIFHYRYSNYLYYSGEPITPAIIKTIENKWKRHRESFHVGI